VLIIRIVNCINMTSSMCHLCRWPSSVHTPSVTLTESYSTQPVTRQPSHHAWQPSTQDIYL
jgi:hypothetical protein